MPRKLFIVARDNQRDFESLRRTLAGERNVQVLYDRRRGRGAAPAREMRKNRRAQEDLERQGWCVVTITEEP